MSATPPSGLPAAELQQLAAGLAAAGSGKAGPIRVTVSGRSMLPLLAPGDSLVVRPARGEIPPVGALVTYLSGSGLMTHRVVAVRGDRLTTKGDNLYGFDPEVPLGSVLGFVVGVERGAADHSLRTGRLAALSARVSRLEGALQARITTPGASSRVLHRLFMLVHFVLAPGQRVRSLPSAPERVQ